MMFKRMLQILLVAASVAALPVFGGLDFFVSDDGALNVMRNGKPIIIGEDLFVLNADWNKVSQPLKTQMIRNNERGGKVVCSWGTDVSTVRRTVERMADGRIKVTWYMKFLNGIVEGHHIELAYLMPNRVFDYPAGDKVDLFTSSKEMMLDVGDGILRFEFSGTQHPWTFQDMRKLPLYGNYRLLLTWPYNPAEVNVVESSFIIGESEKEEK